MYKLKGFILSGLGGPTVRGPARLYPAHSVANKRVQTLTAKTGY